MPEITVTQENFEKVVLQSDKPVLVDFWASWCGPCRMLSPTVEALAEKYDGKVEFGSVNVDEEDALASSFGISVIPTLYFLKNGEIVDKTVGVRSPSELMGIIERLLK